jgi:hypothetical protein
MIHECVILILFFLCAIAVVRVLIVAITRGLLSVEYNRNGTFKGTVRQQAKEAGFKLERIETFLKYDNIYIFQVE